MEGEKETRTNQGGSDFSQKIIMVPKVYKHNS